MSALPLKAELLSLRNKARQSAQARRGTVTNLDLFDAWSFDASFDRREATLFCSSSEHYC